MRENQLPVHYTPNSVQITLTHFSADGSAPAASSVAVTPQDLPNLHNQYVVSDPEPYTESEEARDSKLAIWLLTAAVISVTTLFTTLYTIRNREWVPNLVAQTVKISKQLSAGIKGRDSTTVGGTAVKDTAKAGAGTVAGTGTVAGAADIHDAPTGRKSASAVQPKDETATYDVTRNSVVRGVRPTAPATLRDVDRSAGQHDDSISGAHRTLASDRDAIGTRENSLRHTHNGYMVPPPPPTPFVLPPAFGFFPTQSAQQDAALQQQLQQAQASPKTRNQAAAQENTLQQPTASGRTEATQSATLVNAEQELQAAVKSSLHTVGEWTR